MQQKVEIDGSLESELQVMHFCFILTHSKVRIRESVYEIKRFLDYIKCITTISNSLNFTAENTNACH